VEIVQRYRIDPNGNGYGNFIMEEDFRCFLQYLKDVLNDPNVSQPEAVGSAIEIIEDNDFEKGA